MEQWFAQIDSSLDFISVGHFHFIAAFGAARLTFEVDVEGALGQVCAAVPAGLATGDAAAAAEPDGGKQDAGKGEG